MIDIHAHILPIDDGPKTFVDCVEMCREAERNGVTKIVCTPHVLKPGYGIDKKIIEDNIKILRQKLKDSNINIELIQGAENLYDQNIPIAKTGYILIEFPLAEMPLDAEIKVKELLKKYYVIIAHIERYRKFRHNIEALKKYVDMGCYCQINAESFFKWRYRSHIKKFLNLGMVHFIASDMHTFKEATLLAKAVEKAKKYMPDAENLVTKNPEKMLKGQKL